MLVLARKVGEKIILNDNIEIIVLDSNQNSVRLGVNAPKNVTVYREELYREIQNANKSSNDVSAGTINELQSLVKESTTFVNTNFESLVNKLHK